MSALFPPWSNTVSKASIVCTVLGLVGFFAFLFLWVRSPIFTGQDGPTEQPVQFDHRHHVADDGIDCRYCHDTVDKSFTAGIPPTAVCMNCHSQIWNRSPFLDPVRASYFENKPIPWKRVHFLPDFVYFNHAIHVNKGVGCVTCHGRVDRMALVMQQAPLTMDWCLDCHRDPGPNLRPKELITNMTWQPEGDRLALAKQLIAQYDVHPRTSCTTCHR